MATVILVDQTLLQMGFTQPLLPTQFVKRVSGGQVIVTILDGGQKVRVNARLDDGSFILSQSHGRNARWGAIEDSLNQALALLIAQAEKA